MKKLKQDIISGYKISKNEALKLYDKNLDELLKIADEIREIFVGDTVDLCSIINGKSESVKKIANTVFSQFILIQG